MQETCPHDRLSRGDDGNIYCSDCYALVGYASPPEQEEDIPEDDEWEDEE